MLWALNQIGERIAAFRGGRGLCPTCKTEMLAKCGAIIIWHWAHRSLVECDAWYEPESAWHIEWKQQFPADWQEVVCGKHRADVKTPTYVIELQASSISSDDIQAREQFYGTMVWILKGTDFEEHFDIRESSRYAKKRCVSCGLKLGWPMADSDAVIYGESCPSCGADIRPIKERDRPYWTFRWKHPRKTWSFAKKPIGIDFGEGMIFWIKKIYFDQYCAGWGVWQSYADFISRVSRSGK